MGLSTEFHCVKPKSCLNNRREKFLVFLRLELGTAGRLIGRQSLHWLVVAVVAVVAAVVLQYGSSSWHWTGSSRPPEIRLHAVTERLGFKRNCCLRFDSSTLKMEFVFFGTFLHSINFLVEIDSTFISHRVL
jgi:hypothetical protein